MNFLMALCAGCFTGFFTGGLQFEIKKIKLWTSGGVAMFLIVLYSLSKVTWVSWLQDALLPLKNLFISLVT